MYPPRVAAHDGPQASTLTYPRMLSRTERAGPPAATTVTATGLGQRYWQNHRTDETHNGEHPTDRVTQHNLLTSARSQPGQG